MSRVAQYEIGTPEFDVVRGLITFEEYYVATGKLPNDIEGCECTLEDLNPAAIERARELIGSGQLVFKTKGE